LLYVTTVSGEPVIATVIGVTFTVKVLVIFVFAADFAVTVTVAAVSPSASILIFPPVGFELASGTIRALPVSLIVQIIFGEDGGFASLRLAVAVISADVVVSVRVSVPPPVTAPVISMLSAAQIGGVYVITFAIWDAAGKLRPAILSSAPIEDVPTAFTVSAAFAAPLAMLPAATAATFSAEVVQTASGAA
jgi:hypothetical protein